MSLLHRLVAISAWLSVALLSACAGYGPGGLAPGASRAQAIAQMGAPSGRYPRPDGGERLEFARGPMGRHTYMLDFSADDRLLRSEQVLTERNFYELRPGMSKDEVLQRIGHASNESYLSRQQHQLWSYRYETPFCIWFQVSLDTTDRVAELGHNFDPMCIDGAFDR
jgi:hypothetical protein